VIWVNWRQPFLRVGVHVLLGDRTAIILERLPRFRNVRVWVEYANDRLGGHEETWWMGNLRIVL
jgi:hypothetical protein